MRALMTISSGLEGGMPSTCSSMAAALFSLSSLSQLFLDADDYFPHYEVSRAVQYYKKGHWTG